MASTVDASVVFADVPAGVSGLDIDAVNSGAAVKAE